MNNENGIKKINKQLNKYGLLLNVEKCQSGNDAYFLRTQNTNSLTSLSGLGPDKLTLHSPENKLTSEEDFIAELDDKIPLHYKPEEIKQLCSELCHDAALRYALSHINNLIIEKQKTEKKTLTTYISNLIKNKKRKNDPIKLLKQQLQTNQLQHDDIRESATSKTLLELYQLQNYLTAKDKKEIIKYVDNVSMSNLNTTLFQFKENDYDQVTIDIVNLARREASLEEFRSFAQLRKNIDENRLAMQNRHDGQKYSPIEHLEERLESIRQGKKVPTHERVETTDIYGRTSKTKTPKKQRPFPPKSR